MDFDKEIEIFSEDLKIDFLKSIPKIRQEIKVYKDKPATGDLSQADFGTQLKR